MTLRIILGIIVGGLLGRLAEDLVHGLVGSDLSLSHLSSPAEYVTSIGLLVVLPALFLTLTVGWSIFFGVIWCSVLGALLFHFYFGGASTLDWADIFGFELVYAIVATLVFAAFAADPLQARREFRTA